MDSLHGYIGMLSVRRPRTRSLDPAPTPGLAPAASLRASVGHAAARSGSTGQALMRAAEEQGARQLALHRQHSSPANMAAIGAEASGGSLARVGAAAVASPWAY